MTGAWRFAVEHYLLLPLGAAIAIVWANTVPEQYFSFAQALAFVINDIGMAFVLAYVAQEAIEAALPGGTLYPWRRAMVPVIAAIGGALGAVAVYLGYIQNSDEDVLRQGWPIACAVDVLFCLAIARGIFRRSAAVTFLLTIAIVSDLIGLAVISQRYLVPTVRPAAALLIVPAIAAAAMLRYAGVRSFWPYVCVSGPLIWIGCYSAGMHPAVALLPIVPFFAHTPRDVALINSEVRGTHQRWNHFEYLFEYPVQAIAFLFGLVNGGVLLHGFDTGTWVLLGASLVGRPLGILAGVAIAAAVGFHLPSRVGWRDILVIGLTASPGLTFGLFFAAAVFPPGPLLTEMRIGAMLTSAGLLLAFAAARVLRVGRFGGAAG